MLDERSDIYSMGCVIFEVLTGYPPFFGETAMEVMVKRLEEPPLTFKEAQPEMVFPDQLQQLVSKALEKDLDNRHQTIEELRADLEKVLLKVDATAAGA